MALKKDISRLVADADDTVLAEGAHTFKRTLSAYHLVLLGIGAVIGAGIFSLTGSAAANYAGPGIIFSFIIAGVLCAFAGLCYAEMAAMVPVSGSAYSYAYATLGELAAWIIGWDLILEYAFACVAVSISWSAYFISLLRGTLGLEISDSLLVLTQGPWEHVTLSGGAVVPGIWNVPASVIALLLAGVLYVGVHESARVNNVIVIVKVSIILAFIGLGWFVVDPANWVANPLAEGLSRWVPPESHILRNGHEYLSYGWSGVLTGAGITFFSYIGFDALSTTSQECKNPSRDVPIGIFGSLLICTIVYILTALVLTGVIPYQQLGVADPVALGIDRIAQIYGWSPFAQKFFSFLIKVGALAGLTSVILVMQLGQTRVFYAMSKDGLLPWFSQIHPKYKTPTHATVVSGIFIAVFAGLFPVSVVGELTSIGTLLAFALVCLGIPILRIKAPHVARPFKTPAYGLVSSLGVLSCLWVMSGLPRDTWLRLFVWLFIGFVIYFSYGYRHSALRNKR